MAKRGLKSILKSFSTLIKNFWAFTMFKVKSILRLRLQIDFHWEQSNPFLPTWGECAVGQVIIAQSDKRAIKA